jgi:membrane protein YqaA with SNARE-associated domain
MENSRLQFVTRSALKAAFLLIFFLALYLSGKHFLQLDYVRWLTPLLNDHMLVLLIFMLSELAVGIVPPELFIMWALQFNDLSTYILLLTILAGISYGAGIVGYITGLFLNRSLYFRYVKGRFLKKLDLQLERFGMYLILIAALTPVPFSGVCMLVGSVKYPFKRFLFIALSRFVRFAVYALIFWEANQSF